VNVANIILPSLQWCFTSQEQAIKVELGPTQRTGALGDIISLYVRDPEKNLLELAHYNRADR